MAEEKKMTLAEKLMNIQVELKAPKGQYNKFNKFNYRSAEDILEALKPYFQKYRVFVMVSDQIKVYGEEFLGKNYKDENGNDVAMEARTLRTYVESTATLYDLDSDEKLCAVAYAREPQTKTGMDAPQITGAASSYAKKYALNDLFAIDDTKDPDTNEYHGEN